MGMRINIFFHIKIPSFLSYYTIKRYHWEDDSLIFLIARIPNINESGHTYKVIYGKGNANLNTTTKSTKPITKHSNPKMPQMILLLVFFKTPFVIPKIQKIRVINNKHKIMIAMKIIINPPWLKKLSQTFVESNIGKHLLFLLLYQKQKKEKRKRAGKDPAQ